MLRNCAGFVHAGPRIPGCVISIRSWALAHLIGVDAAMHLRERSTAPTPVIFVQAPSCGILLPTQGFGCDRPTLFLGRSHGLRRRQRGSTASVLKTTLIQ